MGNLFSWGGKGGGDAAPPPMMPMQDNSADMMAVMLEVMGGMGEFMASSMESTSNMMANLQMPEMPATPLPARVGDIDWTEKQKNLAAKMKADYGVDQGRKKTRTGTVLTSPLLDEEDATTTGSVLADVKAGGNQ